MILTLIVLFYFLYRITFSCIVFLTYKNNNLFLLLASRAGENEKHCAQNKIGAHTYCHSGTGVRAISLPRFPDAAIQSTPTCLCGTLPDRSIHTTATAIILHESIVRLPLLLCVRDMLINQINIKAVMWLLLWGCVCVTNALLM